MNEKIEIAKNETRKKKKREMWSISRKVLINIAMMSIFPIIERKKKIDEITEGILRCQQRKQKKWELHIQLEIIRYCAYKIHNLDLKVELCSA